MNFRIWLEVMELRKPGKVTRKSVIKDPGTNVAHKIIQYQFKTSLGNDVKVQFNPRGEDSYDVVFYVNDTLFDFAPRMGADLKPEKYSRDVEILSGVFYLIREKANRLRANHLTFHSFTSERDTKTFRNLDISKYKDRVLIDLDRFKKEVENYEVKLVSPSESSILIHKRLNLEVPLSKPDLNKEYWLRWISNFDISKVEEFKNDLLNMELRLPIKVKYLIESLRELEKAIGSNRPEGYRMTINRRTGIFSRIMRKYFSSDWEIRVSGNYFNLDRKST